MAWTRFSNKNVFTQDPLTVVSNVQQNVTLRFYTLAHAKHGGFLIKYSVLPVSNNATIRLQCYVAPAVSRPPAAANLPAPNLSQQQPSVESPDTNNVMNIGIDQGRRSKCRRRGNDTTNISCYSFK